MACKIVKTSDDETIFNVKKKREILTFLLRLNMNLKT